jgi:predicted DNA-binding protein with PD1-like motif
MQVRDVERGFMLKLERGERVIEALTNFCTERGIRAGVLQAVGAVKNAELGYYNLETREYFFKKFPEDREVASMMGNIALVDGKPFIHAHAVLSAMTEKLDCVGAHIKEAEVAVTLEVYLTPFDTALERKLDDGVGLKLLNL